VENVHGQIIVLLNGFPVYRTGYGMKSDDLIDLPMNTALVGKGNTYSLRIEPWMHRNAENLRFGSVKTKAWVSLNEEQTVGGSKIQKPEVDSAFAVWQKRAREQWKKYRVWEKQWLKKNPEAKEKITWKEGGALDSIRAWVERNPLTVTTTFDNEAGPDFSRIFEQAPRLPDRPATRERLKDYAMHLRDLVTRKDTLGLFEEFRLYYAQQYKITGYEGSVAEDKESLRDNVVMDDPELDFDREDVGLRRWSGGRVWELYREGADAFFQSGNTVREIYVAEIDGDLKVVR
jgi:hypothetical protein